MRKRLTRSAWAVMALIGPVLMGADRAPSPPSRPTALAALSKVFPKPRLYELTTTQGGTDGAGSQFCLGAEPLARTVAVAQTWPKPDSPAVPGCTDTFSHQTDGSTRIELACEKSERDPVASRMSLDVDPDFKTIHQHIELKVDDGTTSHVIVSDIRAAQAGDCPADLKPGEMREAGGAAFDASKSTMAALLIVLVAKGMAASK